MPQIKDYPEQTTPVSTDLLLLQDVSNVTKKITPPNLRKEMVKGGYFDLVPTHIDFTGAPAPTRKAVAGTRTARAFAGTGGTTNICYAHYHVPHEIDLALADYEFHFHLEHNNAAPTGNVKFYADMYFALADGSWGSINTVSVVWTPHATNNYLKHNVVKIEALTAEVANLKPDSMITVDIYRNPADAADTFTDDVFFYTADFHLKSDSKLTTSKDFGAGWVKA